MARTHIHVHLPSKKKVKDSSMSGRSDAELNRIWRKSGGDEHEAGAALQELARRGIDPRTGKTVGVKEAQRIAAELGDLAAS